MLQSKPILSYKCEARFLEITEQKLQEVQNGGERPTVASVDQNAVQPQDALE